MSDKSDIEWTDATWPLLAGCKEISPGCANCYAAKLTATRLKHMPKYKGLAVIGQNGRAHFTGETRLWREHLGWPFKWERPRKIFVADMSDLFYDAVPNDQIAAAFGIMAACPQHTFQVLTKRADRAREWFALVATAAAACNGGKGMSVAAYCLVAAQRLAGCFGGTSPVPHCHKLAENVDRTMDRPWPLPNVHLGVSVENQECADARIPHLLATPAALRFLSCEPLLEDVNLRRWLTADGPESDPSLPCSGCGLYLDCECGDAYGPALIDWVIVGGESGAPKWVRPTHLPWARRIIADCQAAGTKVFMKQAGSRPSDAPCPRCQGNDPDACGLCAGGNVVHPKYKSKKGGDMTEWPKDLQVREFPV